MNTKKILVCFAAIATLVFLTAAISAAQLANTTTVYARGISVDNTQVLSIVEGETLPINVVFTATKDASDVKIKVEIDGYSTDSEDITSRFDVESGKVYNKQLSLNIPYDLRDEVSDDAKISIKIYNQDDETVLSNIKLRVQKESYRAEVMSISTTQTVKTGELLPVDVVLKNNGYNNLDDVYVKVSIKELNTERSAYFGDLVAIEDNNDNNDNTDTVSGRIYLQIPDNAKPGIYTLSVDASNSDMEMSKTKQITVENKFNGKEVLATTTNKNVAVGEDAVYSILIVNPSDELKVYKITTEAEDLTVTSSDELVAVPAGSSKTVTITANADTEGTYNFDVNVFSADQLVEKVALSTKAAGKKSFSANPVFVLTVVLAIVFIVLLIVLFVLLGKKPQKSEDFGESYY